MKFKTMYYKLFESEGDDFEEKVEGDEIESEVDTEEEYGEGRPTPEGFDDIEGISSEEKEEKETSKDKLVDLSSRQQQKTRDDHEKEEKDITAGMTIRDYIDEIERFVDMLNSIEKKNSLRQLLRKLDREGLPFYGISKDVDASLTKGIQALVTIAETLKSHLIKVS